jgi:hypothetical protein
MKTTSTIISSLVLILSLVACGGSQSEDSNEQAVCTFSEWGACEHNGSQARTVLTGTCPAKEPLLRYCTYNCGPTVDSAGFTHMNYCPEGSPFYCPSLTLCYTNATDAVNACTDALACTQAGSPQEI